MRSPVVIRSGFRLSILPRRAIAMAILLWIGTIPIAAQPVDPDLLAGLKARAIGPAGMSGRVTAVAAVADRPSILYLGTAGGGVWKSVNGGLNFEPMFDDQPVHSIGALAIDPRHPQTVWVGTGEGNVRNSVSIGNGIYRSRNGGKTWEHLGLQQTERINRILLHPRDPDIAYVAALGRLWGENQERGLFKTTDGGATWQRVLYVDKQTGCTDVVMDPNNPDKLFAAMWQFRRWPHFFKSGGPGSGLFQSDDGGETWRRLEPEDGLPKGNLGRIGLAIAPSDPRRVYALVEAKESALLRSDDGGETFTTVNAEPNVSDRPFYYSRIHVDPRDPNRLYRLETLVQHSTDGGRTFRPLPGATWPSIHVDHHAIWLNPANPEHIILGNDGGVAESHDHGATFRFVANLPLAQFYHVAVDDRHPYHIYGGLQDNGSWRGPAEVWRRGGIRNHFWRLVAMGDGFDTRPDPTRPDAGYAMSQGGYLVYWDLAKREIRSIRPQPTHSGTDLRYNWNAALALDPHQPGRIYYGSQFVLRSDDRGATWQVISPDLTTNRAAWQNQKDSGGLTLDVTAAENYTSLTTLAPSPVQAGIIWAGSDDGRIHVTRNGGDTWDEVGSAIKGGPRHAWIPHIAPSPHDAGTAFVVLDHHRSSDMATYVYKTTDFGRSWRSIGGDPLQGYALVIEQDPVEPDLLYLGTEFGLWISLNGGKKWWKWRHGVPTASVMDLTLQTREHDLVIATHGRGLFVIDDVSPLRNLTSKVLKKPLHLFAPPQVQQHAVGAMQGGLALGAGEYHGENEPYGALISFLAKDEKLPLPDPDKEKERRAKERAKERTRSASTAKPEADPPKPEKPKKDEDPEPKAEVRIADGQGVEIRTFYAPIHRGLNRVVWDLRADPPKALPTDPNDPFSEPSPGFEVRPGTYTVTIRYEDAEDSQTFTIRQDPANTNETEDWQSRDAFIARWTRLNDTAVAAVRTISRVKADIQAVRGRILESAIDLLPEEKKAFEEGNEVILAGKELNRDITRLEAQLWIPPDTKGIRASDDVVSRIQIAREMCFSSTAPANATQLTYLRRAEVQLAQFLVNYNRMMAADVARYRSAAQDAISLLPPVQSLTLPNP
ncbi:Sortilin-Vps10 domain-containing protein [Sulfidibacter corallicola]|uniref:Sortilin N-terminal domain-containing protein n=1 Tax=Sulfidibacter corallicola TaxID=2818388 RepID=A0A8A4TRL8_SULCO|nr:hypothetical protein [Sulfidibacter corallicola]QTD52163.1 hypothetical protein J3U87_06780 [Sulfidibacter corallicola]